RPSLENDFLQSKHVLSQLQHRLAKPTGLMKPIIPVSAYDQIEHFSAQFHIRRHRFSRLKTQCLKLFSGQQLAHDNPLPATDYFKDPAIVNDSMVTSIPCSNPIIGFQPVACRKRVISATKSRISNASVFANSSTCIDTCLSVRNITLLDNSL